MLISNLWCICCRVCTQEGVLPYGEVLCSISSALVALCLNTGGLQRVQEARVLEVYVPIFTTKK